MSTAAAVCWIVATANHVFRDGDLTVKELTSWFGISGGPSTNAKALLQAIGVDPDGYAYGDGHLSSPDYLTGDHRAGMVAARGLLADRPAGRVNEGSPAVGDPPAHRR